MFAIRHRAIPQLLRLHSSRDDATNASFDDYSNVEVGLTAGGNITHQHPWSIYIGRELWAAPTPGANMIVTTTPGMVRYGDRPDRQRCNYAGAMLDVDVSRGCAPGF